MGKTCNESHPQGNSQPASSAERWKQFVANHLSEIEQGAGHNEPSLSLPLSHHAVSDTEPIRGIVFEVDNVLCDGTTWRRWLMRALSQLGLYTHYGPFFRVWEQDFLPLAQRGEEAFIDVFRRFIQSAGLSPGAVDELLTAGITQREKLEQTARPFPCVRTTLQALQQANIQLAVLSDTTESNEVLVQKLVRLGLSEYLPTVLTSSELHQVKPDGACYEASLQSLGLKASQVLFIAARSQDLAGATTAGMRTIAFNYESNAKADAYVDRFVDLRQLVSVENISRRAA